ncbi:MAG: nucleotidyltransferase domain-containing protein [Chloroflexi bacterium]|nr:nucleotidyltransferase domain-containing protein [Chloroflexota bacterium]
MPVNEIGSTAEIDFSVLRDPRYPVHRIAGRLEPYLRVIVERFHPQRIILFGSYAYGHPTADSDVDLLVIREGIASENRSNAEILNAFWDVAGPRPPFTVLTKTPERIVERLAAQSPFYQEILGKGLEVYAA